MTDVRQKAEELLSTLMPTDEGPLLHQYGGYMQVVGPFEYALIDVIRDLLDALHETPTEGPTRDEYASAYDAWRNEGQRMHTALLAIWRAVEPDDTSHMTYGDDPDIVVQSVVRALSSPPTKAQVEAAARTMFEDPAEYADYTWARMIAEYPGRAEIWRADALRVLEAAARARGEA